MQAIILAGGKGERLHPLTHTTPKPMLPVCGKPIMHHQIEMLQQKGVKSITIVAGYQGRKILDYLNTISFPNLHINALIEKEPLGTAGATRMALEQLDTYTEKPVLVTSGDSMFDFDLAKIVSDHENSDAVLTTVLVPMRSPYGIVEFTPDRVVTLFRERPYLPYPVMSGVYVASRDVRQYLPSRGDMKTVLPMLVQEKKLRAYLTRRYWKSVETIKDLEDLENDLRQSRIFQSTSLCASSPNYSDLQFED